MSAILFDQKSIDLTLEELDVLEAPMDDKEAGILVGIALGLGIVAGALLAT
ncbi:hypothetical protein J2W22_000368 [Sphingomonas kyeonggiensis]|uniref:daptide-type RiPP n=1 Tax=Sphingomonas kyeonggiensis TaxID=1268553 RepID=UPI00278263B5|nr:daptide-type RiPP [Sphingomonas kyeonggiensis]MDQ0248321.1 hypothetical protein [Sphingomonas kyeonggiensis]